MLEIRTLGGLQLKADDRALTDLGSHKAEAILIYVAVGGGSCNRNVIASLLWPNSSDSQALTSLRVALSLLRKDLDDYIEVSHDRVELKLGAEIFLDVTDLELKLAGGDVESTLEVYQGDFLQGFFIRDCLEFEDWRRMQQERIHQQVTCALHAAISSAIQMEEYKKGQSLARRLLELDMLDELAQRKSMLLFALDGQRARALEQYERCRAILMAELGITPSEETQSLYAQISSGMRPDSDSFLVPANILPVPQTSFIGREQELTQIISTISNPACRLLTLVGPGGAGKTRLALRAATKCLPSFSNGTYFVALESITSLEYLISAIADSIHFKIDYFVSQVESKFQLFDYLRPRSILLVLDGFEHLVSGAGVLSELISHASHLKLLVTSRQRLDLNGEWVFPVEGLPVPRISNGVVSGDSSAFILFEERARQARSNFKLSSTDRGYAVDICQSVGGMPLGIELAAAWTPVLSTQEIAQEIQKSLDFLSSSARDVAEKHRSPRAAFNSSWLLLDEGQRDVFCRLSVFQGGFDRTAAQRVAGVSLPQLSNLLDRSMLGRDNAGRYYMHGLLRQYGLEKLNSSLSISDEIYNQHCLYYTGFLSQRELDLTNAKMYTACHEIRREMENVRLALKWALEHWDEQKFRKILVVLLAFYAVQGWQEGKDAFGDIAQTRKGALLALNVMDWSKDPIYLSARIHQAILLCNLGVIDESEAISRECFEPLRMLGLKAELSECLNNLGTNASFRGEYELARERLEEAIIVGKESQVFIWPTYLLWLGHTYFLLGEYELGMQSFQKCYDIYDHLGNLWGKGFALSKMALAADGLGDFLQSMQYNRESFSIFEKTGNITGKAYAISRMSMSAYFLEEYVQAVQYGLEGYQIYQSLGHQWGMCTSLCRLGFAYIGQGEIVKARDCFNDALEQSRIYQMTPVSMYALLGMAAALAQDGNDEAAVELFQYVQSYPQTPTLYIQQATRWITQVDYKVRPNVRSALTLGDHADGLDDIISNLHKAWGQHAM